MFIASWMVADQWYKKEIEQDQVDHGA